MLVGVSAMNQLLQKYWIFLRWGSEGQEGAKIQFWVAGSVQNFASSPLFPCMYAPSTFPAETILFQPPPFLHPDSTPPKRPWIFIGETVFAYYALPMRFVQKSAIAGTSGDEAAHIHIDNLGLPSWQVSYLHFSFIGQFPWVIEPLRLHLRDFFSFSECLFRVSRNLRRVSHILFPYIKYHSTSGSDKWCENLVPETSPWVRLLLPPHHASHPLSRLVFRFRTWWWHLLETQFSFFPHRRSHHCQHQALVSWN